VEVPLTACSSTQSHAPEAVYDILSCAAAFVPVIKFLFLFFPLYDKLLEKTKAVRI